MSRAGRHEGRSAALIVVANEIAGRCSGVDDFRGRRSGDVREVVGESGTRPDQGGIVRGFTGGPLSGLHRSAESPGSSGRPGPAALRQCADRCTGRRSGDLCLTASRRAARRLRERRGANRRGPETLNHNKPRLTDPTQRSCRRPLRMVASPRWIALAAMRVGQQRSSLWPWGSRVWWTGDDYFVGGRIEVGRGSPPCPALDRIRPRGFGASPASLWRCALAFRIGLRVRGDSAGRQCRTARTDAPRGIRAVRRSRTSAGRPGGFGSAAERTGKAPKLSTTTSRA